MLVTSKYPKIPSVPDTNVHNLYFSPPPGASDIPDYQLYIETATERKVTVHEFRDLVRDIATALGAPLFEHGLNVSGSTGDVVGIFSHNSIVSSHSPCYRRGHLTRMHRTSSH
jgi:hypothetical protein